MTSPVDEQGVSDGKENASLDQYEYIKPVNSYFYYSFLSPFCNWLVQYVVPDCLSPDLLSLMGIACTALSYVNVVHGNFLMAGLIWQCYCVLDNLDGKQARKLGLGSAGGEFFDHAMDSLASAFAVLVLVETLVNKDDPDHINLYSEWIVISLIMISHLPFFMGIWSQHVWGKIAFGCSMTSMSLGTPEYISVDEYNMFFIPMPAFIRYFAPQVLFYDCSNIVGKRVARLFSKGLLRIDTDRLPFSWVILVLALVVAIVCLIKMSWIMYRPTHRRWTIPFLLWAFLSSYFKLHPAIVSSTFSLICFEMMVKRLRIHKHTMAYIFYPIAIQLVLIFNLDCLCRKALYRCDCEILYTRVTDMRVFHLLALLVFGLLFTYKNVIHSRFDEPNLGWIIMNRPKTLNKTKDT